MVGVSFLIADSVHKAITAHIQFIVVNGFVAIEQAIMGRIFCHVSINIKGLLCMSILWITFMYHVCIGHTPTLASRAVVHTHLIVVDLFSVDAPIRNTVDANTCIR